MTPGYAEKPRSKVSTRRIRFVSMIARCRQSRADTIGDRDAIAGLESGSASAAAPLARPHNVLSPPTPRPLPDSNRHLSGKVGHDAVAGPIERVGGV